jgi:predicted nuclease of restriction endonuclease-like (RecB) superfamily
MTLKKSERGVHAVYEQIKSVLREARAQAARSVNAHVVVAYWRIGRIIVEQEQGGKARADYGARLLEELSARLTSEFGAGYSTHNLKFIRQFYREYPALLPAEEKGDAPRSRSGGLPVIGDAPRSQSWKPGSLHPDLSWTHYRTLLRVDKPEARAFYEIEAVSSSWSARELERQVNSFLYERLAKSRDKQGLLRLAAKGQEIQRPADVIKDPLVLEFLGLPESPGLQESRLEQALIQNLQSFLLEMGKGFAFVARQHRLTLEGDHFYVDLVFYHAVLKCYVLIDLKVAKLTHGDLGQMQLYVNYFDRERRSEGDNPTVGLILCADKNDAMVRYTLGPENKRIFASRYKLYLPSEKELVQELRREIKELRQGE